MATEARRGWCGLSALASSCPRADGVSSWLPVSGRLLVGSRLAPTSDDGTELQTDGNTAASPGSASEGQDKKSPRDDIFLRSISGMQGLVHHDPMVDVSRRRDWDDGPNTYVIRGAGGGPETAPAASSMLPE